MSARAGKNSARATSIGKAWPHLLGVDRDPGTKRVEFEHQVHVRGRDSRTRFRSQLEGLPSIVKRVIIRGAYGDSARPPGAPPRAASGSAHESSVSDPSSRAEAGSGPGRETRQRSARSWGCLLAYRRSRSREVSIVAMSREAMDKVMDDYFSTRRHRTRRPSAGPSPTMCCMTRSGIRLGLAWAKRRWPTSTRLLFADTEQTNVTP
jgi:hypothetical protein